MEIVVFLAVLFMLNIAAWKLGTDSRDSFISREWDRRSSWRVKSTG